MEPRLATAVLAEKLQAIDLSKHLRRKRTYPGILPFLHLDHIYHEGHVEIAGVEIPARANRSWRRTICRSWRS